MACRMSEGFWWQNSPVIPVKELDGRPPRLKHHPQTQTLLLQVGKLSNCGFAFPLFPTRFQISYTYGKEVVSLES